MKLLLRYFLSSFLTDTFCLLSVIDAGLYLTSSVALVLAAGLIESLILSHL